MELLVREFWEITRNVSTAWRHETCRQAPTQWQCCCEVVMDSVRIEEIGDGVLRHELQRLGVF